MSLELEMNLRFQKTQKSNKRPMAPKALQQPFDLARVWFEGGGGRGEGGFFPSTKPWGVPRLF